ncbi:glycosyltransferase family 4 protein [Sphingomonas crusticola]|uniref:glycosyltransferase family 4 protein n=1 Tax=Sphingomonas crusticola TaxID=1697973 RepID=UPI000E289E16|nr:glycosyltransferase family 1 protein [Sphingomonas crusticola]
MKIALISDAWRPQVNGVVRTLETTVVRLRSRGHSVETITPDQFRTIPCPSYPEIRLAIGAGRETERRLEAFRPDAIHIATEGPLGWSARRWCLDRGLPFSTSFHTRFPDYVALRTGLPSGWFWPIVRRFHAPAARIMVATAALAKELAHHGLPQTHAWSRGVDLDLFTPGTLGLTAMAGLPRPIQLYVGRVAVEKNIDAFLDAPVGGSKVIVGDGPARAQLERRYPNAHFLGPLHGAELASAYASADVFVFPSRTDTFGLVMIEALAAGTPIAAFPVQGPLDIVGGASRRVGALDEDLAAAISLALTAQPSACAVEGRRYSWDACTDQFLAGLCPFETMRGRIAA